MDAPENLDVFLNELLKNDNLSSNVYHYTPTYKNLIEILKKRKLIMTDYQKLPYEIYYAIKYFKDKIPDSPLKLKVSINGEVLCSFWQSFEWYRKQLRVFITSFCLNKDDRALWDRFGDGGYGFSIGISTDHFKVSDIMSFPPNVMMKVHYGESELNKFTKLILEIQSDLEKIKDRAQYSSVLVNLFTKMIPELPRFLPSLYVLEREYRLYAMDLDIPENNTPEKRISSELIFFHKGKNRIFSDEISSNHICEILIGSKQNFDKILGKILEDLKEDYNEMELKTIIKPSQVFFY